MCEKKRKELEEREREREREREKRAYLIMKKEEIHGFDHADEE